MNQWITFLRHAESEGNKSGILQGQIDSGLTEQGEKQAYHIGQSWRSAEVAFDEIVCSPMRRARQTAEIVAKELEYRGEIRQDPIWQERGFGNLEGKSFQDLRQNNPDVDYFHPYTPAGEGGESQVDLYIRAAQGVQDLLKRRIERTLVVSHGAMLGKVLFFVLGITPQGHYNSPVFSMGNTAYFNFSYDEKTRQWFFYGFNNRGEWSGLHRPTDG
jgi:broad specificity phosphatase PhoE